MIERIPCFLSKLMLINELSLLDLLIAFRQNIIWIIDQSFVVLLNDLCLEKVNFLRIGEYFCVASLLLSHFFHLVDKLANLLSWGQVCHP